MFNGVKIKASLLAAVRFWQKRHLSVALAAALVIGVIAIGLHDTGIFLGYIATTLVMLELTRRWRRIRNFIILSVASVLGIIFLAFLHEEVAKPLALWLLGSGAEQNLAFHLFSDIVTLAMIFVGATGTVFGFFGAVILALWRLAVGKRQPAGPDLT